MRDSRGMVFRRERVVMANSVSQLLYRDSESSGSVSVFVFVFVKVFVVEGEGCVGWCV